MTESTAHIYRVERALHVDFAQTGRPRYYESGSVIEVDPAVAETPHFKQFTEDREEEYVNSDGQESIIHRPRALSRL